MNARILVVEDEPKTAETLELYLRHAGFDVEHAADGVAALRQARSGGFDLVLLDLLLPGVDGLTVCRTLRRETRLPVIMLTAKTLEEDRVRGLELGADDYVAKPFSPREVVARVRAVLRRTTADGGGETLRCGRLEVDPGTHRARLGGRELGLTATELALLATLARHPGRVFTRDQLIERALGHDFAGDERAIDAHVKNLRKKLDPERAGPGLIETVFGVGYRLRVGDA